MSKLASYPMKFLQIAEDAANKRSVAPMVLVDAKAAVSTRHLFNRFRRDLAREGHPFAPAASDLIVRIENERELHFVPRGLVTIAEITSSVQVPGLSAVGDDALATQDALETPLVLGPNSAVTGEDAVDDALRGVLDLRKTDTSGGKT
jgi:hypothetical protein